MSWILLFWMLLLFGLFPFSLCADDDEVSFFGECRNLTNGSSFREQKWICTHFELAREMENLRSQFLAPN